MASFRKVVLAAIVKSLLRGKSLIQAILAYWVSPLAFEEGKKGHIGAAGHRLSTKTLDEFLKEAEAALLGPISGDGLTRLSTELKKQFLERLQSDLECMLPSYSHQLPTGKEAGQYLALDVGGSTLRVAVVELGPGETGQQESKILRFRNFRIDKPIKDLEGVAFFDWMAARIVETVSTDMKREHSPDQPLPMALAWSFPIEQTSLGAGKLQAMGKGFMANKGLIGQDLGEIVAAACKQQRLDVEVEAIINDSSACLLSQAYTHPSTRFGLILGTGLNVAVYLPTTLIGRQKFGTRPVGWFDRASHVIVNTELGMFGKDILPITRWDRQLLDGHPRPDFQPVEHLSSGMYLGEIARFALIEAIETTGLFGGVVPASLTTPYSLSTETLSIVESDESSDLSHAKQVFAERHPASHQPTTSDLFGLRALASYVSIRSSALVATCVYTLWDIRLESHKAYVESLPVASPERTAAASDLQLGKTMVAFNGSVIEQYPNYLGNCQRFANDLVLANGSSQAGTIELVPAKESSLIGAAVASACVKGA
ncbi:uncharacterized protein F5Z01DRAFT_86407 [Emericellopsis atlantica]|uniref:Phosphotransferase n=1 Tax=Emericellopsis atlantica TaxID=2614577 RepID=A0A9P8CPL4_9HYPO|nr:uncharacterized protein F5Z01DRAFT_86407 [Emericellopsis atlantica]KAG9254668.1 hypothetical protein F5Z01DRAFT_86407 [Emericellopsis atlantica]